MPRISHVRPENVTEPDLVEILEQSRTFGTPRLESQAIRAHVPAVLRTFRLIPHFVDAVAVVGGMPRVWHQVSVRVLQTFGLSNAPRGNRA